MKGGVSRKTKTIAIVFTIAVLIYLRIVLPFSLDGLIFANGDRSYFLNHNYSRLHYVWSLDNYGRYQTNVALIPQLLISILGSPMYFYSGFYVLGFITFLFMVSRLTVWDLRVRVLTSFFYVSNIFVMNLFYYDAFLYVLAFFPLWFTIFVEFIKKPSYKVVFQLVLVSFFIAPGFLNTPFIITCGLVAFIKILFDIKKFRKKHLFFFTIYVFLLLLTNIYWLPHYLAPMTSLSMSRASNSFTAVNSGYLYDNFRLLGLWGWYTGSYELPYFSYSNAFYTPLLLFLTYAITIAIILEFKKIPYIKDENTRGLLSFFLLIFVLFVTLSSGAKYIFGKPFSFLYNNLSLFWMYREPFIKFGFVVPFALSFFIGHYINGRVQTPHRFLTKTFVIYSIILVLVSFPFFTGQYVWQSWNGSMRDARVMIPDSWAQLRGSEVVTNSRPSRIITVPFTFYGVAYNWVHGLSSSADAATYLLDNPVTRGASIPTNPSDYISNTLYINDGGLDSRAIGFMNNRYILRENDVDWRYAGRKTLPPSSLDKYMASAKVALVETYGKFSEKKLESIPNNEKDPSLRNELYYELIDRPELLLYQVNKDDYIPHFYVPRNVYEVSGNVEGLRDVLDFNQFSQRSVYYFTGSRTGTIPINTNGVFVLGEYSNEWSLLNRDGYAWDSGWAWPSVVRKPGDIIYFLTLRKEILETTMASNTIEKIDKYIWSAAKRVQEIKEFDLKGEERGRNINLFKESAKKAENLLYKEYDSYRQKNSEMSQQEIDRFWGVVKKLYMYIGRSLVILDYEIKADESEISGIITDYEIFKTWLGEKQKSSQCGYHFQIASSGDYDIYLGTDGKWEKNDTVSFTTPGSSMLPCGRGILASQNPELVSIRDLNRDQISKFQKISGWGEASKYKISFDYLSGEEEIKIGVYEDVPDYSGFGDKTREIAWDKIRTRDVPTKRVKILEEELKSFTYCGDGESGGCYGHYENTFVSNENSSNGYVYMEIPIEGTATAGGTYIKNLSVKQYFEPKVLLVKRGYSDSAKLDVPKISFTEVNPTKYIVTVENASVAFPLVFVENFSPGWRLYIKDLRTKSTNKAGALDLISNFLSDIELRFGIEGDQRTFSEAYFDGDVTENKNSDVFFGSIVMEGWGEKPIPQSDHLIANGFANSWLIDPKVVGGNNFTLVIEFWPQRLFYVGILISTLTVIMIVTFLIIDYARKYKDKNKD